MTISVAVHGQTQRGQIVGRVTDTTGAVVPAAKVEVESPATGVKAQSTKVFVIREKLRVRFAVDGHNLLNRHIQPYQGSIGVTGGGPRQLQLGLRVGF